MQLFHTETLSHESWALEKLSQSPQDAAAAEDGIQPYLTAVLALDGLQFVVLLIHGVILPKVACPARRWAGRSFGHRRQSRRSGF